MSIIYTQGEWCYDWLGERWSQYDFSRLEDIQRRHYVDSQHAEYLCQLIRPPKRSRKNYHINIRIAGIGSTDTIIAGMPPLTRQPNGTWTVAKTKRNIAQAWPDEELEAFSAVVMTKDIDLIDMYSVEFARDNCYLVPKANYPQGLEMIGVERHVRVSTPVEATIFLTAYGVYKFLRLRKQVPGIYNYAYATDFAWRTLLAYRKHRKKSRRPSRPRTKLAGFPDSLGKVEGFPYADNPGGWKGPRG